MTRGAFQTVAEWEHDGLKCWATTGSGYGSGMNGYCQFPERPTIETGYDGILTYVPVHGGITYAEEKDGAMVYGFDTAHFNSEEFPCMDLDWIKGQVAVMVAGIRKAAEVEEAYLLARTNEAKAEHAQQVLDIAGADGPEGGMPFGATINLLGGEL